MAGPEKLDHWRIEPGSAVDLGRIDSSSTPAAPGGKKETEEATIELRTQLAKWQAKLAAEKRQSLLVVLQAMDTGGKDGTIRNVFAGVNPVGVRVTSFKAPSDEELAHDFLWRAHRATPATGEIAIFNRSYYEDVLVVRVHELVPREVWSKRYRIINDFEHGLAAAGTTAVKLHLHISKDEQAERLRDRVKDPDKRWKFNPDDLAERAHWTDYRAAYEDAIAKTATDHAPWYVIPADHKWYRDYAVLRILVETLAEMNPQFPKIDIDPDTVVIP